MIIKLHPHLAKFLRGKYMKVTIQGKPYKVGFAYEPEKKLTYAFIEDLEHSILFQNVAILGKKDQFNKKIGRKVALAKVLKSHFGGYENKSFRTELWNSLKNKGMKIVV